MTVVGAGVTGLTAAIEAAEQGWRVTIAEAHSQPGGRARSLRAPFKANVGPHAIYVDGPWWAWLERRGLTPPMVPAPHDATVFRAAGRLGGRPEGLAARYSLADPTLAPPGHELIQIAAACAPHERKADAQSRVLRLLDQSWPGWRARLRWQRGAVRVHCTGAVDLPGTTWHDRPAIDRGQQLKLATDQSAAPGLLTETGIAAQLAVQQLGSPHDATNRS